MDAEIWSSQKWQLGSAVCIQVAAVMRVPRDELANHRAVIAAL